MANILDYVANNAYAGQPVEVKAKKFVWVKVGQGTVSALTEQEVTLDGQISILGYMGNLTIQLNLNDGKGGPPDDSCRLQLNKYVDEQARYEAADGSLTVYAILGDKEQNITIQPCNNGEQTECKLFGHVNQVVHLDPVN